MPANRGGRRPDPEVDEAIRQAMAELLFERGLDMTFDDVAARAGVGRTTVFRRFPTKRELLVEAFSQVSLKRFHLPDTGSVRDDLCELLTVIMREFGRPELRMLLRQGLGEACRDPDFTGLFRDVMKRRLELISSLVERGIERGTFPPGTDARLIADLISGVISIRVADGSPLPGAEEISALVDGLLYGFATSQGSGGDFRSGD
ncbi:TetR/AcrR family transcriptional regulator [Nonomuraea sp. FMUSA5-5]|uniref:TetR/AcrR family transcriptional regulator n=1 Tax=Nonomuraea composti TaxID=2720023 RepID=A0ABX1BEB5_9ACTN|nr:TetR/AcrR family transcriptional regulator [Nonomuraea sp. FMUSA5-5]NJP94837.1 TetR/AcrR family transcriptional regulator [Nonomuraea sp. FMUSA5-5]